MRYNPKIVIAFFRDCNLPSPETEYQFDDVGGRKWRFDFAWPPEKIALEVEGGIWTAGRHVRGKGVLGDMEKYNTAVLQGWRVLRVVPDALCLMETVDMIEAALVATPRVERIKQRQTAKLLRHLDDTGQLNAEIRQEILRAMRMIGEAIENDLPWFCAIKDEHTNLLLDRLKDAGLLTDPLRGDITRAIGWFMDDVAASYRARPDEK